jgi:hypothetical protein
MFEDIWKYPSHISTQFRMFSHRSERLIAVMAFVFVGLAVAAPAPIENRLQLNPIPM